MISLLAVEDTNPKLGELQEDPDHPGNIRQRVAVLAGHGPWAYWTKSCGDYSHCVIADVFFADRNPNFAGQLEKSTFDPQFVELVWCTVKGWSVPQPEKKIYIEDEDAGLPRFERR